MIGKSSHKISKLQAELHLLKVEKLDACIRPLFANLVTYVHKHLSSYLQWLI